MNKGLKNQNSLYLLGVLSRDRFIFDTIFPNMYEYKNMLYMANLVILNSNKNYHVRFRNVNKLRFKAYMSVDEICNATGYKKQLVETILFQTYWDNFGKNKKEVFDKY